MRVASGAVDAIVLHHILSAANFQMVAGNLRESFRALARGRQDGAVVELPGVSIASLGVAFQMFNAAFLSERVESTKALEGRLEAMRGFFRSSGRQWSFWVCEDWLDGAVQRRLSRVCESYRLRLSAEMPGMLAARLTGPTRVLPEPQCRRVACDETLNDFRALGARCFHVPPEWFEEVFDARIATGHSEFAAWVAYENGTPVATAATVRACGATGLYNIATAPLYRHRGLAEALTRHVCRDVPAVLQSTSQGFRMYQRMGFSPVTRILVYNSW